MAGARRFRAAQLAELFSLPARVVELTDGQALEWALVENSRRVDVPPYEEAQGFQRLLDLPGYDVAALVEKSGTFAAQTLAARYGADPSAADWRRFGRLPGFTNCKPKYKREDGLFSFVRLQSHSGQEFLRAKVFMQEITAAYEIREREREQRRAERALSPQRGPRSLPSLERFRASARFVDRPAAADIAFCIAAYASGMDEAQMEQALEDHYLSRDPSPSKRAAYIRRTMTKTRD